MNPYLHINRLEFILTDHCTGRCRHCSAADIVNHPRKTPHAPVEASVAAIRFLAETYDMRSVMTFAFIFLFAFMTYLGYDLTINAKKVMNYSGWSYKYMDAALPLGFASMTIYSIKYFLQSIFKPEEFDKRYENIYDAGSEMQGSALEGGVDA